MKWSLLALALSACAFPALADEEAPDKSDFTLFNPTPDADLRSFNTDRPPKANYLKDTAGSGYHVAFDFLINVSHPLGQRCTFYSEVFTSQVFQSQDKPVYTLDEALSYALPPNLQLDFGGNFSLNSVPPRTQLYMGLSQRF